MRIVVALGGNALLERGERPEWDIQDDHVRRAATSLAELSAEHELIVTHGNGPQVGLLAQESEQDPALSRPYPFDVLGAQTQGMIGYWLVQALHNAMSAPAVCVVCRTVVREDDPAFADPAKFVGPVYDQPAAARLATERGWRVKRDGSSWRRVVASPRPVEVVELPVLRELACRGTTVVCAGGGGIPVVRDTAGRLRGVEAVVDKDLTASLLATELGADGLLLLTDVDAVYEHYGTPRARPTRRLPVGGVRPDAFAAGSMGPKIEAARRFVSETGKAAAIGNLFQAADVLAGRAGTAIVP